MCKIEIQYDELLQRIISVNEVPVNGKLFFVSKEAVISVLFMALENMKLLNEMEKILHMQAMAAEQARTQAIAQAVKNNPHGKIIH